MHEILHFLGLCGDQHSHLDLMDLLIGGGATAGAFTTVKYYWNGIILYLKSIFIKNIEND